MRTVCVLILAAAVLLAVPAMAAESATAVKTATQETPKEKPPVKLEDKLIVIETDFGKIVIETMPQVAPKHVERFVTLAERGFYNGCTYHRVIPGFMIQGGDPNSKDSDLNNDGTGNSDLPNLKAEFNSVKHEKGICSSARTGDPNSANCQFFIMHAAAPHLDGQYTAWGKVISGLEIVDKIALLPKNARDNPGKAAEMKRVYTISKQDYAKTAK